MPACLDDVIGDSDGRPTPLVVGPLDVDADAGGGSLLGLKDADLVVSELDIGDRGIEGREALADAGKDVVDRGREYYDKGRKLAEEAGGLLERGRKMVAG